MTTATTTTVHDIIRMIRESASGNRNRGSRFEELMLQYLSTDPQWTEQLFQVTKMKFARHKGVVDQGRPSAAIG